MSSGIREGTNPPLEVRAGEAYCGGSPCEVQITSVVALVSGRWAVAVLEGLHFAGAPTHFLDLQRRIGDITQKELSRHLTRFVHHGVVSRRADEADGRRIHYSLTERGHALMGLMDHLGRWRSPVPGAGSLPSGPR